MPIVLTAHASVAGASYGSERTVMLGSDIVLPGSLVRDPRLDYVALGHIHKSQDLNPQGHPPVIYPGSIERVDFGECNDEKYFILARVSRGETQVEWRKLDGIRPFIDRSLRLKNPQDITAQCLKCLPDPKQLEGAIVRLVLEYPREYEELIDETALRQYASEVFEFHLIRRPMVEARARLAQDEAHFRRSVDVDDRQRDDAEPGDGIEHTLVVALFDELEQWIARQGRGPEFELEIIGIAAESIGLSCEKSGIHIAIAIYQAQV